MKTNVFTVLAALFSFSTTHAQLTNGSTAPDFTLTDINGTSHHLYDYLDAGKTVYIDFFAAHCPTCWNYKNSVNMSALYTNYGPDGTDEIMVIAIELDANNGYDELHGISGFTQGDWVTPTPYPIVNPEGAERSTIISSYAANYYPLIYGICANKTIQVLGTQTTANLYNYHSNCAPLGLSENESTSFFQLNDETVSFAVNGTFTITDLSGRFLVKEKAVLQEDIYEFSGMTTGVYLLSFEYEGRVQTATIFRQ